jgi:hypothetical protein
MFISRLLQCNKSLAKNSSLGRLMRYKISGYNIRQAVKKIVALNKKEAGMAIEAFRIGFDATEMPLKLNLEVTKPLFRESLASIDALAGAGDTANLSKWTGQFRAGETSFRVTREMSARSVDRPPAKWVTFWNRHCLVSIRKSWNGSMKC